MGKWFSLPILSGVLIVLAFPPWDLSFLLWIALVPWLIFLERFPKYAALSGFLVGFVMSVGGYYWVAYSIHNYGRLPWPIAILGLLIFASFNQAQFAVYGTLKRRIAERLKGLDFKLVLFPLFFSSLYLTIDSVFPRLFVDELGHAFYNQPWPRQLAEVTGVGGLTFLVLWTNEVLSQFYFSKRLLNLVPWCLVILSVNAFGYLRSEEIRKQEESALSVPVAAIQANIGEWEKVAAVTGSRRASWEILKSYVELSTEAAVASPKPALIVWPETAYPSVFKKPRNGEERARDQLVQDMVNVSKIPLAFGGYDTDDVKDFNSVFFVKPEGDFSVYHKSILLMFGEYLPFSNIFPSMNNWFPGLGDFGRGPGPTVFSLGEFKLLPIVCYEALLAEYTRPGADLGANLILNVTNDSWFGKYGEPYLHLALTVFRSIETRIPQLRATNTGITALIDAGGNLINPTRVGEKTITHYNVPLRSVKPTVFAAWGDWFRYLSALFVALSLAVVFRKARA